MSGPLSNPFMFKSSAAGAGGFYDHQIANSLRGHSNSRLQQTVNSAASSGTKVAISFWHKMANAGTATGTTGLFTAFSSETDIVDLNIQTWGTHSIVQSFQFSCQDGSGSYGCKWADAGEQNDPSAFKHIVLILDSTQGTSTNRAKLYINGDQKTTSNTSAAIPSNHIWHYTKNSSTMNIIERYSSGYGNVFNGYLSEVVLIDGAASISDFGETKNGVWIPKDPSGLTFGNNGYWLKFESSSDLGNDSSGNNNDFTATNLAAHDQMLDSPTFGSEGSANFPTVNVLDPTLTASVVSNGNLQLTETITNFGAKANFAIPLTGKWYWEAYLNNGSSQETWAGITGPETDSSGSDRGGSGNATTYGADWSNYSGSNMYIRKYIAGVESSESGSFGTTTDTIIGIAINRDDDEAKFYKDNALQFTTAISATQEYFPAGGGGGGTDAGTIGVWNFGQDGTFAGNETAQGNADGNGYGNFYYSPPTDHLALCSGNLPTATEVDPAETDDDYPQKLFIPKMYTGTGEAITLTIGFQPDLTWVKNRQGTNNHILTDSSRGVTKSLGSDLSAGEDTEVQGLTAFGTDSFTLGTDDEYNSVDEIYGSWSWRANGGSSSNSDGATSSTVQADPSGAFSIVTYTGFSGSDGSSTVGHGMGVAPQLIWHKATSADGGWWTQNASTTNANYFLQLDDDRAQTELAAGTYGTMSRPTTSVFSINGVDGVGGESRNYVAYCFASIEGHCKVGSYEGNGNADGSFVYCGFSPALIICKSLDSTSDWQMFDNKREGYNVDNDELQPNNNTAEGTDDMLDILSNGFKLRIATDPNVAETYVYLAFAHNPFQYATAR